MYCSLYIFLLLFRSQMEISASRARVNTAARARTGSEATPARAPTCTAAPTVKLVNVMIYKHVMCEITFSVCRMLHDDVLQINPSVRRPGL